MHDRGGLVNGDSGHIEQLSHGLTASEHAHRDVPQAMGSDT